MWIQTAKELIFFVRLRQIICRPSGGTLKNFWNYLELLVSSSSISDPAASSSPPNCGLIFSILTGSDSLSKAWLTACLSSPWADRMASTQLSSSLYLQRGEWQEVMFQTERNVFDVITSGWIGGVTVKLYILRGNNDPCWMCKSLVIYLWR